MARWWIHVHVYSLGAQNIQKMQLEQLERFKIHTWLYGNGGRRREIGGCEDRTTPAASSPNSGETAAAGGGSWLGLEEDIVPVILVPAPVHSRGRW
ncbi:hypothetical protein L3X38_008468 [Prunus dulcis]|uniref:Uncharacterized protein n=1 Tax=Prunus dulcis TaxID=3755 RepID=A0AAD4ZWU3_PRUDU|nr:hypothetical protein L3X38_008468 [Prunus dulcis]